MVLEVPLHIPLAFALMKLRGFLTVATVGVFLVLADLVQRLVIVPLVWVAPARKERVLAGWQRWIAGTLIGITRVVGGAKFEPIPTIPSAPGVLVLMNHRSLLDIPIVVRSLSHGYPRIVTRKRYARGVPLISRMLRLYDYPVVDPTGPMKEQLKMLGSVALDPRVPIVVYPEGTRSRDGALLPFRRGAVDTLLRHRQWGVYLLTSDGTLPCGRLRDMLGGVDTVRCRVSVTGPFATPSDPHKIASWLEEMEGRMRHNLVGLRQRAGFSERGAEISRTEAIRLTERRRGSRRSSDRDERRIGNRCKSDGNERVG
jgi:1-acyl-sn-glycerol-3-phosphate acyltransferase